MLDSTNLSFAEDAPTTLLAQAMDSQPGAKVTLRDVLALRYIDKVGDLRMHNDTSLRVLAEHAYTFADAMLSARSR